jgi:lipopolysaccharide export system protein LptC
MANMESFTGPIILLLLVLWGWGWHGWEEEEDI